MALPIALLRAINRSTQVSIYSPPSALTVSNLSNVNLEQMGTTRHCHYFLTQENPHLLKRQPHILERGIFKAF